MGRALKPTLQDGTAAKTTEPPRGKPKRAATFCSPQREATTTISLTSATTGLRDYTGFERGRIKSAISVLAAQGLVHVEHTKSIRSDFGIANAYRLAFIQPRVHMGEPMEAAWTKLASSRSAMA
jgi:hypothetical protein